MPAVEGVELPIVALDGRERGKLRLRLLPDQSTSPPPLVDERSTRTYENGTEAVQLLEDREYRYEVYPADEASTIAGQPGELLTRDTSDGFSGRLRPGSHTGRLTLSFSADGRPLGTTAVEVRSRKLGYLEDYRWMIRDIATAMSEVVMERFAPTEQRFAPDHARDAATLYQRFAFLQNLIVGETFEAAVSHVLGRPHHGWISVEERRSPGRGAPGSSRLARQLSRAGPRVCWPHGILSSLPRELEVERHEETLDTTPNRFVKFALERWRDVVVTISDALGNETGTGGPAERGSREAANLLARLDALLSQPLFREVSDLTHFPVSDQVLQKREGYREVFRAYVEFEVASKLAWEGGEDVYGAGQRDVATLYEYWAFFELVQVVGQLCSVPIDLAGLVSVRDDGLAVDLQRGRDRILLGEVDRLGRKLAVELWFNREFRPAAAAGSWSRTMRPDYSLRVSPALPSRRTGPASDDVWLHFDAKYRVQSLNEVVGPDTHVISDDDALGVGAEGHSAAPAVRYGRAKAADLVKMHAYRDAIRRSAGAYVLYPGTEPKDFREYHEILPGLGAFALRPTEYGQAEGSVPLLKFMGDVMEHIASQLTQHERSRYWQRRSFDPSTLVGARRPAAPFLQRPPADTLVLLGYVRGTHHLEWIRRNRLYNLRAGGRRGSVGLGSRELAADLVLLYGDALDEVALWEVVGEPQVVTRAQLVESGYPSPRGNAYYCLPVRPVEDLGWKEPDLARRIRVARERLAGAKAVGAPVTTSWLGLVQTLDATP